MRNLFMKNPNKMCEIAKYGASFCYSDKCANSCKEDGYVDGLCKVVFAPPRPVWICFCLNPCASSQVKD